MSKFNHFELKLIQPAFESRLTDLVIELEHLRKKRLAGTTHPATFFQLKSIFHTLESIGSARIEGNRTTISEFIETKIEDRDYVNEAIQEIRNVEKSIEFIDEHIDETSINKHFVCELHSMIVKDLTPPSENQRGEGDKNPGNYRNCKVQIKGSKHVPPETQYQINDYMEELFEFIKSDKSSKYDLLKVALAHHRFMWIHPFGNGNGRVGRLLTYAMLIKAGFNVNEYSILNPTAVFCNNRDAYYDYLSQADKGSNEALEQWCTYVLSGLKNEIDKVDRLLDYIYLKSSILLPAIEYSRTMKYVDSVEYNILKVAIEKQSVQNSDLKDIFKNRHETTISRDLQSLRNKKMLISDYKNSRKYNICFTNNFLIRGVIKQLEREGFIPMKMDD